MRSKIHTYTGQEGEVKYDSARCIHSEECIKRLSIVFNSQNRPWIQPNNAAGDRLAATVQECPSGALHYTPNDNSASEALSDVNTIRLDENGPLYVRGDITLKDAEGTTLLKDTRVALCRCGASENKPLCDNTHKQINFQAPDGFLAAGEPSAALSLTNGEITANATHNGPLQVTGNITMLDGNGQTIFTGTEAWLCRCGGSANKPFCDGTHSRVGFEG